MIRPSSIETPRLRLRRFREADLAPFAEMNADPLVTEFLPRALSRTESDALVARFEQHVATWGYGIHAVERLRDARFLGFVGLQTVPFEAHFTPAVEIGWRLAREAWGQGYASEAAQAVLVHGFGELGLKEIVSFTVPANHRSRRVMEKIGMRRDPADDFDHPRLEPGDPLRRHVLYRSAGPPAGG